MTSVDLVPTYIRSDNERELIAHALNRWSKRTGATAPYIDPGAQWQEGFAESFNSRLKDEFLNTELFATVAEDKSLADR